jgi:predicted short-subunit dehydrogenase-like oxidoreductase (DUF2520 family)
MLHPMLLFLAVQEAPMWMKEDAFGVVSHSGGYMKLSLRCGCSRLITRKTQSKRCIYHHATPEVLICG